MARAKRKSDGVEVAVKAIDKELIDDSMDVNNEIRVRDSRLASDRAVCVVTGS